MKLIVVESPAKARTIEKFLGEGYKVAASYGHIRDLPEKAAQIPARYRNEPWRRLAVNVDDDFEPIYVVSADSKEQVAALGPLLDRAEAVAHTTEISRRLGVYRILYDYLRAYLHVFELERAGRYADALAALGQQPQHPAANIAQIDRAPGQQGTWLRGELVCL